MHIFPQPSRGLVVLGGSNVFAQGGDVGTWKLNVAKSTGGPGPASKSRMTTIEAVGTATKLVTDR